MNKEKVCKLLCGFDSDGIICYAYRETAFALLADGKCDGTLHLITDAPTGTVIDVLTKNDCRDITVSYTHLDVYKRQGLHYSVIHNTE